MQTTQFIWFDGKMVPWDEAKIHVLTHTLHYSGGAFEGIRCYKTAQGTAIFRLPEHVDRLLYSVNTLGMAFPYKKEEICAAIVEVVRINKLEEGYVRPIAFYGYGKMGVSPMGSPVNFAIACWPWGAYLPHDRVKVKTSEYMRIHPRSTKVEAKLCGHYLNGVLASLELRGTHYHEVLFLDENDYISEGAGENFFMLKNGVLYTPQLGTILAGITRDTILKIAKKLNIPVKETNITLQDAYQAEEAFFTGTAAEVTPIFSIDDHELNTGQPTPVTDAIKQTYHKVVRGEDADFTQYLTYI